MKWPESVPVLGEGNMCIGPFKKGECGCLAFWCKETFGESAKDDIPKVSDALVKAHKALGSGVEIFPSAVEPYSTHHIDEDRTTRGMVARVWNRAMAYLGYRVGNPECDRKGNLKPV